jgi:trk system potassium uptake protein TrkH
VLGVGGMQLYKAETPGPLKDERITPRIARTAKNLCVIYVILTAACALSFWLAGMDAFDAVAHALTTLSTGGYSTHDASLAYFASPSIEATATVFMLIGGISFSVHFVAWRTLRLSLYGSDTQVRAYLLTVLALTLLVTALLWTSGTSGSLGDAIRVGTFEVASVITSTGFGIEDFSVWPVGLPALLIFSSFIGGCAGSSAGGMKVIRFVIMGKQARAHVRKLIHPQAVTPIKVNGRVVQPSVIEGIWGFFTIYVGLFALLMVVLMIDGMDQITAFGAVATCLNNLGPGLGDVAANFAAVSDLGKYVLVLAMLFGRLEIFTLLVLLTPEFWRR